jgi:hypothetical protein
MAILVVEPTHALPDLAHWHRRELFRHQLRLPLEPTAAATLAANRATNEPVDNDIQSEVPHLCPIPWLAGSMLCQVPA